VTRRRWRWALLTPALLALALAIPLGGPAAASDIRIHGLVSQGYMRSTDNNFLADTENGSFEFSEAIINFSTKAGDNLRVGMQLLARDMGAEGNNTVGLDWAYGDYRLRKNLGIRFGKLKSHIGMYNKGRDVDMLRTPVLLPQSVYDETTRDFAHSYNGFSIYANPLVPVAGRFNLEAYLGTLPVRDPNSSFWQSNLRLVTNRLAFLQGANLTPTITEMTVRYVAGGMLMWHAPVTGLRLGGNLIKGQIEGTAFLEGTVPLSEALAGSGLELPPGASSVKGLRSQPFSMDVDIEQLLTASAEYSWRDLLLAAELLYTHFDVTVDIDLAGVPIQLPTEVKWQGYYLMGTYRFSDLLEVGATYGQFYPNRDDKDGRDVVAQGGQAFEAWRENIALSCRLDLGENWLAKLEAHRMDGVGLMSAQLNPQGFDRNWYLFLAKVSAHF